MRRSFLILIVLLSFAAGFLSHEGVYAKGLEESLKRELAPGFNGVKSPDNYGTFILKRDKEDYPEELKTLYGLGKVVFPHWFHRIGFTCKVCHADIGFIMKLDANNITMTDILQGRWCGKCHNGKVAFAPLECKRCHSLGNDVPENHRIEDVLKELPKDAFGNKVNWVKALQDGKIRPRSSIYGDERPLIFGKDIDFPVTSELPHPGDITFPHKIHTEWLHCTNCHTNVFNMKAGGNPELSMTKNFKGSYCGVCHGKVAFPFEDCFRCHGVRDVPPYGKKKRSEEAKPKPKVQQSEVDPRSKKEK